MLGTQRSRMPAPVRLVWGLAWPARVVWRRRRTAARTRSTMRKAGWEPVVKPFMPDRPGEPAQPAKRDGAWAQLRRHRRAWLGPVAAAVLLAAAGYGSWGGPTIVGPVSAVGVCGAAAWWWLRQVRRRHREAVAAVVVALAWLAWPLTLHPKARWDVLAVGTLVVVEARRRHFKPRPPEPAEVGPADLWDVTLGALPRPAVTDPATGVVVAPALRAGLLPGSRMDDPDETGGRVRHRPIIHEGEPIGFRMLWQGVPGLQTVDDLRAAGGNVASLYRRTPPNVIIEGHPGDHSRAVVSVYERSPLATPVLWRPGQFEPGTGLLGLSTFPDASRGYARVFAPGRGVKMGGIFGDTGSGKTDTGNAYLGSLMTAGITVLDLVDLGESSLPAWIDVAMFHGWTVPHAVKALRRANAIIDNRQQQTKTMTWVGADGHERRGVTCLDPCQEWPLYLVVVDEWPELLVSLEAQELADRIGRKGRKYGVAILVLSQGIALHEAFPQCALLRNQMQIGNMIGLHADSDAARMAFGQKIKVNLSTIPSGQPGLGYLTSTDTERDVWSRMDWPASPCPTCRGAGPCTRCGGIGLVSDPWLATRHAVPGRLHPTDLQALEGAADRPRRPVAGAGPDPIEEPAAPGTPSAAFDEHLEEVMARIAAGREVGTGDVAQEIGPGQYERVRKGLARLADDPTRRTAKVRHGVWTYEKEAA